MWFWRQAFYGSMVVSHMRTFYVLLPRAYRSQKWLRELYKEKGFPIPEILVSHLQNAYLFELFLNPKLEAWPLWPTGKMAFGEGIKQEIATTVNYDSSIKSSTEV